MIWDRVLGTVFKVIDRVVPDPAARDAMKAELVRLEHERQLEGLKADVALAQMQADVNKVEAASDDPFKSRWRPAVGWVCCAALAYQFIGQPLLAWVSGLTDSPAPPALDLDDLLTILLGLLGLGGLRTTEKLRGKA